MYVIESAALVNCHSTISVPLVVASYTTQKRVARIITARRIAYSRSTLLYCNALWSSFCSRVLVQWLDGSNWLVFGTEVSQFQG